jgi:NAD(P)-dependent dehydrogenase (short-subunit alcohol dehydrogenase family)
VIINQIVLPFMQNNSSILYIGSTLSEKAIANCVPYVVTKHAILGLMRSTCQDVSKKGVHTCCICPGFTDTETLQAHMSSSKRNIHEIIEKILIKRLIKPEEIANIIFTCANQQILNGSVMHVNLGSIES